MSTDISPVTTTYQVADRRWLLDIPDYRPNVTLDISKFTAGTHYPNGYIPSGTVIAKITATGLFGPYTSGATDGTQTAYGLTLTDTRVIRSNGSTATRVGNAAVVHDAAVSVARLPFQTGAGSLDAAARTALARIQFEA